MKKDYIVLNGADATYTNSRLQWNLAPNTYFKNLAQDGHEDIYMKLKSINFTVEGTADSVAHSAMIDTNLKFQNMEQTSNNAVLGCVGIDIKQDSATDYYITPTNQLNGIELKTSKFNTIQVGVKYQNAYLDFSLNGLQSWFTAVLEIEYRDNNLKELL